MCVHQALGACPLLRAQFGAMTAGALAAPDEVGHQLHRVPDEAAVARRVAGQQPPDGAAALRGDLAVAMRCAWHGGLRSSSFSSVCRSPRPCCMPAQGNSHWLACMQCSSCMFFACQSQHIDTSLHIVPHPRCMLFESAVTIDIQTVPPLSRGAKIRVLVQSFQGP